MSTIKHITTPAGVTHDIGGGGGSSTYTLTKSGNTITLTGSGGDVSSVVDANTTYSLSISGDTLTLTPSSGSAQSVTIPDTDTTYTISISGSTITLTPSSGSAQTITIPDATTTSAGVMSASDKTKLDGIQSGAEVNVQSDWSQSDSSADDYIKNKPSLATVATTGDYDDLTNKPNLATVATTGDYDDLTNKPTIPTVNNGTLTIQQNGVTLDTFTANQSGNTTVNITASGGGDKNIWYAVCTSSYSTTAKTATTTTADFVLEVGSMVRVKFSSYNTASSPTLNVDGTGAKLIKKYGTTAPSTRTWRTGEVVDFVYDGANFIISDAGTASTDYYGYTKLSSSTSSTSTDLAATPSAVKDAYDLANSKTTSVTLTQAQYDALSDAEKNNGTVYYISDGEDCCLDGIIGSGELDTDAKTLVGAVNELASKFAQPLFKTGQKECIFTGSTYMYFPIPAITGYTCIGIIGWQAGGGYVAGYANFDFCIEIASQQISVSNTNYSSGYEVIAKLLYIRNDLY